MDGVPTPWEPKPIKLIMEEAERRRFEVLSLANTAHVKLVLDAILSCIELRLDPSAFVRRGSA
ncbi:MAG TPA: hypothetical protein VNW92_10035 [Polyangiaceae bacterium]|nr:hypothetical protein [Polyangiaceae bacterium]